MNEAGPPFVLPRVVDGEVSAGRAGGGQVSDLWRLGDDEGLAEAVLDELEAKALPHVDQAEAVGAA
jgi:hypothetical protein